MINLIRNNKKNLVNAIIVLIYSIISFIIIMYHEPWRDEAQQWLIVRDLKFTQILAQMKYEGHFVLWYLILFPFAKMGFPYITENIISWGICVLSVSLIVYKSPFKLWFKILFMFSVPMIYIYPVISRCYCLIPLAISLIALTYKNRKKNPILYILSIVLLINTHVIMLGLAGILILLYVIEEFRDMKNMNKKERKGVILSLIIGFVLSVLSILPIIGSIGTNKTVSVVVPSITEILYNVLLYVACIWYEITFILIKNDIEAVILVILIIIFTVLFMIYDRKKKVHSLMIFYISVFYQLCIYILLYGASEQKIYSIIFILFLVSWIKKDNYEEASRTKTGKLFINIKMYLIIAVLVLNIIFGLPKWIIQEIKYNFSSAKETAYFINKNLPKDSIITCNNMPYVSSIIPYTKDVSFYSLQKDENFTYVTWEENTEEIFNESYLNIIKKMKEKQENIYYISLIKDKNAYIEQLENEGKIVKIFESQTSRTKENYIIYNIVS